ncbi:hypothetical protein AYL99_10013 [Fonsecaea erecta]|uniref:CHAT domain-containing protein n=1 Tax=Fonsecaea erecta TaxID=1367422 RepID=A0A178Z8P4_9EURO|nr:hypothetical protein AYL99_10013 [Fonsecaea erecta]OAP55861.1 hypothetical protein AYL99_10013 [Fonsecaea erecta]
MDASNSSVAFTSCVSGVDSFLPHTVDELRTMLVPPHLPPDNEEPFLFILFRRTNANFRNALESTTSEISRRIAIVEDAIEKYKHIVENSQERELKVRTHNMAIAALELRCFLSPSTKHREQYMQYFNTAVPDIRDHPAEYSFREKWKRELQMAGAVGGEMPSSSSSNGAQPLSPSSQAVFPPGDDERIKFSRRYAAVAERFNSEYDRTYDVKHLAESVDSLKRAVYQLPDGFKKEQIVLKDNLCTKLGRMAEATGSSAAISEALVINKECREAAEQLPDKDGRIVFARTLLHAGILLKMRALSNGTYSDLDQAIECHDGALQVLKAQSGQEVEAMKVALTIEITACLTRRFWTFGGCKTDVERAVRLCTVAQRTRRGYEIQATLSEALLARYHATRSPDDFHRAFVHGAKAVLQTDRNDPKYAEYLQFLAEIYLDGYENYARQPNLRFIRARARAVRPGISTALPRRRYRRITRVTSVKTVGLAVPTHRQQDLKTALLLLRVAATSPAVPMTRLLASARLGLCLCYLRSWSEASAALDAALALLPRAVPRILPLHDTLGILKKLYGMSTLAAGAKLRAGKSACEALMALESGRCYLYGIMLYSRPVQAASPDLANQRNAILARIDTFQTQDPGSPVVSTISEMVKNIDTLKLLDSKIRQHPGLENFQRPLTEGDLISLASEGPIVCFITNQAGSYLIAVTQDDIRKRKLTGLDESKLRADVRLATKPRPVTKGVAQTLQDYNKDLSKILSDLWTMAVQPALDELGLLLKPATGLTSRIWWITSDLMGLLPIHAAGQFNLPDNSLLFGQAVRESAGDFIVSSYTPSFRLLQESRRNRTALPEKDQCHILMVAMPETAGCDDLNVAQDIESVQQILKLAGWREPVVLMCPSKAEVVVALLKCHIAIFACHGTANRLDPSRSGLLLRANERGVPEILSMTDLQGLGLMHARLACLLACSTGKNAARWLWDECIHIAGGFQLAGFSEVIATLHPVQDRIASRVTKALMGEIVQRREDVSFAGALHSALKAVSKDDNVVEWCPFVHFGA